MWIKYLSTKFILAAFSLVGGLYLALTCEVTLLNAWTALVGVVLGAFNIANVAQDWVVMKKEKGE